ncbi:MAG: isoaspartyl peptidase/L-asparaginase, partial [Candidatus Binatia bacterium]
MTTQKPAVIVHGGAGSIKDDSLSARLDGCKAAALAAWKILEHGGSAVDAAEAAVVVLEDNPLFNAGTGSTLNSAGTVEMDAGIMDGDSLRAGAVVGADGSGSRAGVHVGVICEQVDLGLEAELPTPPGSEWAGRVLLDWGPVPGSYGWVFPK